MTGSTFDFTKEDSAATPVTPVRPEEFDIARYEAFAAAADERFAEFWQKDSGVMVWQRVRAGRVFRDACRDMQGSLELQLGALNTAMDLLTDAPTYLEPWYGIGTTASAFGGQYQWHLNQAPAMEPMYRSLDEVPELIPLPYEDIPIMQYTLRTIEYFLEQTGGRVPMSWSDLQHPFNVATMLIDTSAFLMGFYMQPERIHAIMRTLTDVVIGFTQVQTDLIGDALARPGHGFASSRRGNGIALSTDNIVMVSPQDFIKFCAEPSQRIGEAFGGVMLHSCGNWGKWLPLMMEHIPNLLLVDGAFSPQTDPAHNRAEDWRDVLVESGVVMHARIIAPPEEVIARVKRMWKPGLKLVVTISNADPEVQHQLYHDIHAICQ